MSTNTKVRPLTKDEAIAQVAKWIDEGMPGGTIATHYDLVVVMVDIPASVDTWCAALEIKAERYRSAYGVPLEKPWPVLLPGWALDVRCEFPEAEEPPFQIEVAA